MTGTGMRTEKEMALIARIHIAKAKALNCEKHGLFFSKSGCCPKCGELGGSLPDYLYRQILLATGGYDSCRHMDEKDLEAVMGFMDEAGFSKAWPHETPKKAMEKANEVLIRRIFQLGWIVFGKGYAERINGFVKKCIEKESIYGCDQNELRKIVGWIRRAGKTAKGDKP